MWEEQKKQKAVNRGTKIVSEKGAKQNTKAKEANKGSHKT
jgi:hypothetical protein